MVAAAHFHRTTHGFRPVARAGLKTGVRDRPSIAMERGRRLEHGGASTAVPAENPSRSSARAARAAPGAGIRTRPSLQAASPREPGLVATRRLPIGR